MADQEIKIRIEAEGGENLDELWKKFERGSASLKEITVLKKGMNAAFRDLPINTAQYNEYEKRLARINDLQRDVRLATRAGHEAYFQAGLELRQLALAGLGANTALGKLSSATGGAILNAVQLKQALVPLGISMGGVGIAGVALGSVLVELAPQIWELVAGATEAEKAFKKWADKVIETHDNLYELLTVQDVLTRKLVEQGVVTALVGSGKTGAGGLIAKLFLGDPKETEAQLDKLNEAMNKFYAAELKRQEDLTKKQQEENAKRLADTIKTAQAEAQARFNINVLGIGRPTAGGGGIYSATGGISFARPSGPAPIPRSLEGEPGEIGLEKTFREAERQSISFTQQMAAGFANATSVLAQGFVQAFGLGRSLLDQFLAAFLGSLAQTGLTYLTGGLFEAIGIGGVSYSSSTTNNAIALGSVGGKMEALSNSVSSGVWRVSGNDLVYVVDRNSRILDKRRY